MAVQPHLYHVAIPSGEVGNDNVSATVEKVKRPRSEKFFIPFAMRAYAILGVSFYAEFRHDSCNTEQG